MIHFLVTLAFAAAMICAGFALGWTVRGNIGAIRAALGKQWHGPRGSGR